MDSAGWIDSRVCTIRVYPPFDGNRGAVCGSRQTDIETNINQRTTLSKKIFYFKLGLEFVDIKSRS
jgi:hypothetical protein